MKCLIICLLVTVVILGFNSVSSRNIESTKSQCDVEIISTLELVSSCGPSTFEATDFIYIVNDYINQTIDSISFKQSMNEFCTTLKTATTCSLPKFESVSSECWHAPLMERYENLIRILARLEKELCVEQVYYNIVNDRGAGCLFKSDRTSCNVIATVVQEYGKPLDDQSVCTTMKRLKDCGLNVLDECQSGAQIRQYVEQAWNSLNEEFTCVF